MTPHEQVLAAAAEVCQDTHGTVRLISVDRPNDCTARYRFCGARGADLIVLGPERALEAIVQERATHAYLLAQMDGRGEVAGR